MTGRPRVDEAAPYYFTYISQVTGDDVLHTIESQIDEVRPVFSGISEEESLFRYAPDKWSIRQVLNHITDTERAFTFRALWFARGFDAPLPSYDQNIAASGARADEISWASHVAEFEHVRLATIALFRNLPAEAWMRSGIASDNSFTVRALAYIIAGHLAHHVRVLSERYRVAAARTGSLRDRAERNYSATPVTGVKTITGKFALAPPAAKSSKEQAQNYRAGPDKAQVGANLSGFRCGDYRIFRLSAHESVPA